MSQIISAPGNGVYDMSGVQQPLAQPLFGPTGAAVVEPQPGMQQQPQVYQPVQQQVQVQPQPQQPVIVQQPAQQFQPAPQPYVNPNQFGNEQQNYQQPTQPAPLDPAQQYLSQFQQPQTYEITTVDLTDNEGLFRSSSGYRFGVNEDGTGLYDPSYENRNTPEAQAFIQKYGEAQYNDARQVYNNAKIEYGARLTSEVEKQYAAIENRFQRDAISALTVLESRIGKLTDEEKTNMVKGWATNFLERGYAEAQYYVDRGIPLETARKMSVAELAMSGTQNMGLEGMGAGFGRDPRTFDAFIQRVYEAGKAAAMNPDPTMRQQQQAQQMAFGQQPQPVQFQPGLAGSMQPAQPQYQQFQTQPMQQGQFVASADEVAFARSAGYDINTDPQGAVGLIINMRNSVQPR